jgi:hypothetical protein
MSFAAGGLHGEVWLLASEKGLGYVSKTPNSCENIAVPLPGHILF